MTLRVKVRPNGILQLELLAYQKGESRTWLVLEDVVKYEVATDEYGSGQVTITLKNVRLCFENAS
jgi:hypothetical protein